MKRYENYSAKWEGSESKDAIKVDFYKNDKLIFSKMKNNYHTQPR